MFKVGVSQQHDHGVWDVLSFLKGKTGGFITCNLLLALNSVPRTVIHVDRSSGE